MDKQTIFTDKSSTCDECIHHLSNGGIVRFFGGNNKQPENYGFEYEVKSIKKFGKLISKINKKFSPIELTLI